MEYDEVKGVVANDRERQGLLGVKWLHIALQGLLNEWKFVVWLGDEVNSFMRQKNDIYMCSLHKKKGNSFSARANGPVAYSFS